LSRVTRGLDAAARKPLLNCACARVCAPWCAGPHVRGQDCPMLICCTECKQVVEIPTLREHLLEECEFRDQFRPCPKCGDALHSKEFNTHVASCKSARPSRAPKCALCHAEVGQDRDGWLRHLLEDGCPSNPRGR
jgi:centrosomal protein CEP104